MIILRAFNISYSEHSLFPLDVGYIMIFTIRVRMCDYLATAKIFENGRSPAVHLPKKFRLPGDEVIVNKIGDVVLLMSKQPMVWFFEQSEPVSSDFIQGGREMYILQERETL